MPRRKIMLTSNDLESIIGYLMLADIAAGSKINRAIDDGKISLERPSVLIEKLQSFMPESDAAKNKRAVKRTKALVGAYFKAVKVVKGFENGRE